MVSVLSIQSNMPRQQIGIACQRQIVDGYGGQSSKKLEARENRSHLKPPHAIAWELYCWGCCPDHILVPWTDSRIGRWLSMIEFISTADYHIYQNDFLLDIEKRRTNRNLKYCRTMCQWFAQWMRPGGATSYLKACKLMAKSTWKPSQILHWAIFKSLSNSCAWLTESKKSALQLKNTIRPKRTYCNRTTRNTY